MVQRSRAVARGSDVPITSRVRFASLAFPCLPFASLPFPPLPFPSLPFPSPIGENTHVDQRSRAVARGRVDQSQICFTHIA